MAADAMSTLAAAASSGLYGSLIRSPPCLFAASHPAFAVTSVGFLIGRQDYKFAQALSIRFTAIAASR
jgi:hypothetical protein